MREGRMEARMWCIAGILGLGLVSASMASRSEPVALGRPLASIPLELAPWRGVDTPLAERIVQASGVDEHLNRIYRGPSADVHLYVGYYRSQRTGDLAHSPKHCLPGAGWQPIRSRQVRVEAGGRGPIEVNEYLIAKGLERTLILYWYQGRGRVVASEYWAKFYLVRDALLRNRTEDALVRVTTTAAGGDEQARARLEDFVRAVYPHLASVLTN